MKILIKTASVAAMLLLSAGCFKDLDTNPIDPDEQTPDKVYADPANYKKVLAKLYAGYAVTGQEGPSGRPDITGIDEGFGQYLRMLWYHQELSTDEAIIGWGDQTIKDFHWQTWTPADNFIYALYSRINYQISVANEFIRETTDEKLDSRGTDAAVKADVVKYRAEARFLRAFSYWHALDLFRNPPFAVETDALGTFTPKQTNGRDLFNYIESECLAMEADLAAPRTNEYARADQAAAWALLAKLYLNAEVYIGEKRYDKCLEYCDKLIAAGYQLAPEWEHNFLADNHKSPEIIFPIAYDGIHTRTWGGTTFIVHAAVGGTMNPGTFGIDGGWAGLRTTRQFVEKFPQGSADGTLVAFNEGKTGNYPKIYLPNSTQGFNAEDVLNSLSSTVSGSKIYEGYRYFPAGASFRVAQYPDNTFPPLGDDGSGTGKLVTNGADIAIPTAGVYYIRVNLANKTYVLEKRDWSIIGTATGGTDIDLVWDATEGYLTAATQLSAGTYRFRANKSDVINLGDNGADAVLELGGAELTIAKNGGFQVALDLDKPDYTYRLRATDFDRRGKFHTDGQNIDIAEVSVFTEGYAVAKWKNRTSDGKQGSDARFPDTDFPVFRLADIYLMAAESVLRNGGDKQRAADYFNKVRERAFKGSAGNFSAGNLTLDIILDERARELYWECHRRTDLVRFGQFTDGSYLWAWKGNTPAGATVGKHRDIFPLPSLDLNANPTLLQNPGY